VQRADVEDILAYTAANFPSSLISLEARVRAVIARVAERPYSAQSVSNSPDVRVVPLIRYPFRIFYRIAHDQIEILHVHHSSRKAPEWDVQ
jgi:plasmid stabilization system protein ParE